MMTFRKLSAASAGRLLARYFTEATPDPAHDFRLDPGKALDSGERLTSYYTGRDSRATWRPDMSTAIAAALGVDHRTMPRQADLERLFEARRADTGAPWSDHKRKISAFDLTMSPHKSVTLAAEFARTPAEAAMIWHAIDRANDAAMRYAARELGWARMGKGGRDGAEPGAVAWVSFRHHTARPTVALQDGRHGPTHLIEAPIAGDPFAHVHNTLFNLVATASGRIGSLDTQALTKTRLKIFGGFFQAVLADELREIGVRVSYHENESAVVIDAIPKLAVDTFSKGHRSVLNAAKAYARRQGLEWDDVSAEGKQKILGMSGLASRLAKHGQRNDREVWRDQATGIGWEHTTVLENAKGPTMTDRERHEQAAAFVARHLATEFHTAAVIDHDKLQMYAVRGLIGTGIKGRLHDIDEVVRLVERRGIEFEGEHVALITGMSGETLRITNSAQVRVEQSLAKEIDRAAAEPNGALRIADIATAIARSGMDFEREPDHGTAQKRAIYALGQAGGLAVLTGVAGSGKTTLLTPLVDAWQNDTTYSPHGRRVVGTATAWRQADALKAAGIKETFATSVLLKAIESGKFTADRNTVLVIDEMSQLAPRSVLKLLELQRTTGMTVRGLADREQAQSVEAGDTIEIMRRVMPREMMPELRTTVRQVGRTEEEGRVLREIAGLFRGNEATAEDVAHLPARQRGRKISGPRLGDAGADDRNETQQSMHLAGVRQALRMKQDAGSAYMVGGDYDQVLARMADFYIQRRDVLKQAGSTGGITATVLTNADATELSMAIRSRIRARGELGSDEVIHDAIDQRGVKFSLPVATGDSLRLYRVTWGAVGGRRGSLGNNGDIVEVAGKFDGGLVLRTRDGRVGKVKWRQLTDESTGRLLAGFGHALTIDAAQGITSDEHINALPRGTSGMTGFTAYVAESRARGATWTLISEEATLDAVKSTRALGDREEITRADLWEKVAKDMASKPYKSLGVDLVQGLMEDRDAALRTFMRTGHSLETAVAEGANVGVEVRNEMRARAVRGSIPRLIATLDAAILAQDRTLAGPMGAQEASLRDIRERAELSRREIERAAERRSGPSAGM